jgi:rhamnosyltransferase
MSVNILIILASFNGEKFIYEQIQSILKQSGVSVDIFVFDDISTDSTVKIVQSIPNSNIRIFLNETSSGSAANNFCNSIRCIPDQIYKNYHYVALSDQDDVWHTEKLKTAIDKLKFSESSLYSSNLLLWDQKTGKESIIKKDFPQKEFDFLFEGGSAGCTYVFTSNFAVELKNQLSYINYYSWKNFSHDWFIYFYARYFGHKVFLDNSFLIRYRIHEENVYGQINTFSLKAIRNRLDLVGKGWYSNHIEGFSQILPDCSHELKIYNLYSSNWFSRFWLLLRYNFSLFRSKKKFFAFALIILMPKRFFFK